MVSDLCKDIIGCRQGAESAGSQIRHDYRVHGAGTQVGGLLLLLPQPAGMPTWCARSQHVALQGVKEVHLLVCPAWHGGLFDLLVCASHDAMHASKQATDSCKQHLEGINKQLWQSAWLDQRPRVSCVTKLSWQCRDKQRGRK